MERLYINNHVGFIPVTKTKRQDVLNEVSKHLLTKGFSEQYVDAILLSKGYSVKEVKESLSNTKQTTLKL